MLSSQASPFFKHISRSVFLLIVLAITLILLFWLGSRYPDLNAKTMMAEAATVSDVVSVWPIFPISSVDPLWKKIALSSINWVNDNLKGMIFGVLLGGIALALISLLPASTSGSSLKQIFLGSFMGSPLGVCVNCAAPIFRGVVAKQPLPFALSMMLSSPTLNIMIISLTFTLFPWYLALMKMIFTVVMIFIIIPGLAYFLRTPPKSSTVSFPFPPTPIDKPLTDKPSLEFICGLSPQQSLQEQSWWIVCCFSAKLLWRSIGFIAVRTVPLMFLAGVLGATIAHTIPFSVFSTELSASALLITAFVATALPVPIGFDVILSHALYQQGFPIEVITILLCGLGIFSLYAFLIIWRSTRLSWAVGLLVCCLCFSILASKPSAMLHQYYSVERPMLHYQNIKAVGSGVAVDRKNSAPFPQKSTFDQKETVGKKSSVPLVDWVLMSSKDNIDIYGSTFLKKTGARPNSEKNMAFEFVEGQELGLTKGYRYGIADYVDPFWVGRGTGAGDYNQDGWVDIAFGSSNGPILYLNKGGWFESVKIPTSIFQGWNTYSVVFADLDNDGWLDLFLSTFKQGNFWVKNYKGVFDFEQIESIGKGEHRALLTVSPSFADIDGNGQLDLIEGNMALGIVTGNHQLPKYRTNAILFNKGGTFSDPIDLSEWSGETMTSLVADFNQDGRQDIYFGNDFKVPDRLLWATQKGFRQATLGDWEKLKPPKSLTPNTPVFTMSVDVGDINNDLKADLLLTGTLQQADFVGKSIIDGLSPQTYWQPQDFLEMCQLIKDPIQKKNCLLLRSQEHLFEFKHSRHASLLACERLPTPILQQECLVSTMWFLVTTEHDLIDCQHLALQQPLLQSVCQIVKARGKLYQTGDTVGSLPQKDGNYLWLGKSNVGHTDSFEDINQAVPNAYQHPGGWTWNSVFIDIDNDGWQDILTAQGAVRSTGKAWNTLLHNIAAKPTGRRFEQKQFSWGWQSNFGLYSFVKVDFDNDGDLDIIANSAEGPVSVYRNQLAHNMHHAVSITLQDQQGNRRGIGATVTVRYTNAAGEQQQQKRWVKASGGYQSANPAIVWFGLGEVQLIDEIKVHWLDGDVSHWQGAIPVDRRYHFKRNL